MKLLTTALFAGMLAFGTVACAKEEPKKPVTATPTATAPAAAPVTTDTKKDEAPKTKRVCVDVKDKEGKPVKNKDGSLKQNCRDVKQHKKHEGTKVPDKK